MWHPLKVVMRMVMFETFYYYIINIIITIITIIWLFGGEHRLEIEPSSD